MRFRTPSIPRRSTTSSRRRVASIVTAAGLVALPPLALIPWAAPASGSPSTPFNFLVRHQAYLVLRTRAGAVSYIPISAYSWGLHRVMESSPTSLSGPVIGPVRMDDLVVTRQIDQSSPSLVAQLANATAFDSVLLEIPVLANRYANVPENYYQPVEFRNPVLISDAWSASPTNVNQGVLVSSERLEFTYDKATVLTPVHTYNPPTTVPPTTVPPTTSTSTSTTTTTAPPPPPPPPTTAPTTTTTGIPNSIPLG